MVSAAQLGIRLKAVREFYGWSQRELAKRAGVPNSAISVIEQGSVSPSVVSLEKVLNGFPLTLADFFTLKVGSQGLARLDSVALVEDGFTQLRAELPLDRGLAELQVKSFSYDSEAERDAQALRFIASRQTLLLVSAGEVLCKTLSAEMALSYGGAVSISPGTLYQVEPLVIGAKWLFASCD